MSRYVIRLITDPTNIDAGPLVAAYNPDAHNGAGELRLTLDPAQALTFPDMTQAIDCYRQTSTVRPVRPDGLPNRPLTAYTVTWDELED